MGATPPVSPVEFESAVIQPGDRACTIFTKITTISRLLADWYRWAQNDDGTPTVDYLDWAGAAGGTGLSAPSNVTATSNNATKVVVSWGSVEGATAYRVFRGLTSDTRLMQQVGSDTEATTYDDSTGDADVVYFYAVKAFNATLTSGFSGTASGKMVTSTDPVDTVTHDVSDPGVTTYTVPEGKNRMEVELWGGGGKGGDGPNGAWVPVAPGGSSTPQPGGGGASGSYYHLTGVVVVGGEQFSLVPGGSDQDTQVVRVSDGTFAKATAGRPGGQGTYVAGTPGTPGEAASAAGSSTLATGSAGAGTTVGNPGDGQYGGAAVVNVEGYNRGKGGDGATTVGGSGSSGTGGRIRLKFTAV